LDIVSRTEGAKAFVDFTEKEGKYFAATPNAEIILESLKNIKLKKFLRNCHLSFADSASLLWASRVQAFSWSRLRAIFEFPLILFYKSFPPKTTRAVLKETVCGSDIFYDICKESALRGKKIMLLGGLGEIPQKTKEIMEKKYKGLQIVSAISGSPFEKDDLRVRELVNKAAPDILFLAYGCPLQELWVERNLPQLKTVKIAMGIGGTFDFVAGKIKRAPVFMRKLGVEWLWRLVMQPSRILRIFKALFLFPYRFLFR
jgi:N-acetylglucosaminyldiphosphoundecaprenol N-acetyl-beta-D-mannosaminyltransferase